MGQLTPSKLMPEWLVGNCWGVTPSFSICSALQLLQTGV